ncbi:acyl-CoA thioesterase II [Brevundimonas sp.]|uniref:acyl-CoA thioesterase n=1 Tax=Brevundimonas sp. TaxID=1871086 RepID=UPI001A36003A|nr:acyl-CoA thioesterase domain-containing protein [Brevundimonas sp.]MBJ7483165.1 thioesterase family protein [Brevundimonas sp.]
MRRLSGAGTSNEPQRCETISRSPPTATELLGLDIAGEDRFRARVNLDNLAGVTFGGQALGQALAAAGRTAPDWPASSLSGYFLRGGVIDLPIEFEVRRLHDGRRFASRFVEASQLGRPIFSMLCSFHDPDAGVSHQTVTAPDVVGPAGLANLQQLAVSQSDLLAPEVAGIFQRPFPIEVRLIDPGSLHQSTGEHRRDFWFRMPSAQDVELPRDHQALLALMSDYWLPGTIAMGHQGVRTLRSVASLNHSIWFHRPARADAWLLYTTESPWADEGRGLSRGLIFDQQKRLVATVTQEASLRWM